MRVSSFPTRGLYRRAPRASKSSAGISHVMQSTMQEGALTITVLLEHGARVYGDSEVVTAGERGARRSPFAEVAGRVARLANALRRLGIRPGDAAALGPKVLSYAELLAAETPTYDWPALDERAAAAMCYTSGTTGNPKGVVYSHRSTVLHSLSVCMASVFGLTQYDRVLLIVPMFHANAWGLPYAGWLTGADLLMPGRCLQPEPLCRLIAE